MVNSQPQTPNPKRSTTQRRGASAKAFSSPRGRLISPNLIAQCMGGHVECQRRVEPLLSLSLSPLSRLSHTPNPKPQTPNPKPQTPNPKPQTPNPKPQTPHPKRSATPRRGASARAFCSPRTRILPRPRSAPRNPHPLTMLHETRSIKLTSFIWVVLGKVTYLLDVRGDSSRLRFSWIFTYKTLKASFWPCLSDSSPETVSSCCNFARSWVES